MTAVNGLGFKVKEQKGARNGFGSRVVEASPFNNGTVSRNGRRGPGGIAKAVRKLVVMTAFGLSVVFGGGCGTPIVPPETVFRKFGMTLNKDSAGFPSFESGCSPSTLNVGADSILTLNINYQKPDKKINIKGKSGTQNVNKNVNGLYVDINHAGPSSFRVFIDDGCSHAIRIDIPAVSLGTRHEATFTYEAEEGSYQLVTLATDDQLPN